MTKIFWTPSLVEERLSEAADVLKRMPKVTVPGYFCAWPHIIHEFEDLVGQEPSRKWNPPTAKEISRMEETLSWTIGLDPVDAKIVWLRAYRKSWKLILSKVGLCRSGANEHWLYALCVIAWRLNGQRDLKRVGKRKFFALLSEEIKRSRR